MTTASHLAMCSLATCSYTEFSQSMGAAVRFTAGAPRWRLPYRLAGHARLITPDRSLLRLPKDAYTLAYRRQLEQAGVGPIRAELSRLAAGAPTVVLLCYERLAEAPKDGHANWCHRTLFAAWWVEQTGDIVPELGRVPACAAPPAPPSDVLNLFDEV